MKAGLVLGIAAVVGIGVYAGMKAMKAAQIPFKDAAARVTPGYCDHNEGSGGWTFMYADGHWEQVDNAGNHWVDSPGDHPPCGQSNQRFNLGPNRFATPPQQPMSHPKQGY